MPVQRPKPGPLVLVVDCGLPHVEKEQYGYRGGLFVTASQIRSERNIPESIKTAWLDGSLDDDEVSRIKKLINTNRVAVYDGSREFAKLRRILEKKLRPLPPYRSDNPVLNKPREEQIQAVVVNGDLGRLRALEASLARANEQIGEIQKKLDRALAERATFATANERLETRNQELTIKADDLQLDLELANDELAAAKRQLEQKLQAAKTEAPGIPQGQTKRNITLLRGRVIRLGEAIKQLEDYRPKIPRAALLKEKEVELGHLTFAARCLEAQFVTVMNKVATQQLPSEDKEALLKLQDMLKEHTADLRAFIVGNT